MSHVPAVENETNRIEEKVKNDLKGKFSCLIDCLYESFHSRTGWSHIFTFVVA